MKKYMKSLIILCAAILIGLSICASSAFAQSYCYVYYPYAQPLWEGEMHWGAHRTTSPLTRLWEGLRNLSKDQWEDGPEYSFSGYCYDHTITEDGYFDVVIPCPPYNPPVTYSDGGIYTSCD